MSDATNEAPEDVRMMDYFMHLEYHELVAPNFQAVAESYQKAQDVLKQSK